MPQPVHDAAALVVWRAPAGRSVRHCLPKAAFRLYTRPSYRNVRWSFSFTFTLPGRTKPVIRAFSRRIDISECTFFALLIYQFTIPKKCFVLLLLFHIVCNDIAKFAHPPCLYHGFLCKTSKYTSCTVFRLKFIHFIHAVNSRRKTRAIFVRFCPANLQFTSFFLRCILLS